MVSIEKFDLKSCPFCGGDQLVFDYSTNQGHGDRSYSGLRVACTAEGCDATYGISNWGIPDEAACLKAVAAWNKRNI